MVVVIPNDYSNLHVAQPRDKYRNRFESSILPALAIPPSMLYTAIAHSMQTKTQENGYLCTVGTVGRIVLGSLEDLGFWGADCECLVPVVW